jgi:hypothetical protein
MEVRLARPRVHAFGAAAVVPFVEGFGETLLHSAD